MIVAVRVPGPEGVNTIFPSEQACCHLRVAPGLQSGCEGLGTDIIWKSDALGPVMVNSGLGADGRVIV